MSTHLRQQFLDRLQNSTLANLATTGTRVEVGRATPLAADASATLLIDLGAEQIEPKEILRARQRLEERTLELIVRGAVKGSGYLATLNAIAYDVEVAIAGDQSLGGLSKYVQLVAIDEPEIEGQGEKTVAVMAMHFHIYYATKLNAPQTAQ